MNQSTVILMLSVWKVIEMTSEVEKLLKQIKAYRNDMVARNYPFQQISDIITKWEMKKDFLEEAEKEKKELEESYQESVRQAKERKEII